MSKTKHPLITILNILIFFISLLFYYTGILPLSIKGITPLLILPILTAFSIFNSPLTSAITGLLCGVFMDCNALNSYCFNAIVLVILGTFVAVSSNNLFNKNIFSAMVLSLVVAVFYFVLQWAVFETDNITINDSLTYLLKYAFPTAVYSAVFIIPFYYLYRYFERRKES
ncbi:MAG: rod shape-determining protein MreD [Clostridia bacterium]|nr:rod shape-determining protein MreD [Clostridia bacterium]